MRTVWSGWFKDPSTWAAWFTFLKVLFGLPLDDGDLELFRACTGRTSAPASAFNEAWLVCGRRAGKSLILALVAVFLAVFRDWRPSLAPGERAVILVMAADRRQARVIFRYVRALLGEVPALATMIQRETAEAIDLSNRVTIEIVASNYRGVRGFTLCAGLCDELAFWSPDESGANPDVEVLAALRPAMSTVPGAILLAASSPYGRSGALWKSFKAHFGHDDAPVLVWRAPTRTMNPTMPQSVVDEAMARDPASAAAEYLAEFRDDVAAFMSPDLIEAAVDRGVTVRPPLGDASYIGFSDPSGGVADSFTAAVAHAEGNSVILDALIERRPPFNPQAVAAEIAALLRSYGLAEVTGDRYSAGWVVEAFAAEGIVYRHSTRDRSTIYGEALPLFTAGRTRLLDSPRLTGQLAGLERRASPGGKDRVDHGPHGRDDLANSACGALVLAAQRPTEMVFPLLDASPGRPVGADGLPLGRGSDFDVPYGFSRGF